MKKLLFSVLPILCGNLCAQIPGELRWEFLTGDMIEKSSPALGADGTVYIGSQDGKVYALDEKTGLKRWEFYTGSGQPIGAPPVLLSTRLRQ